jgi:GH25 family lysozyme M1 (1,4-beta-N-acetylmuramidase)
MEILERILWLAQTPSNERIAMAGLDTAKPTDEAHKPDALANAALAAKLSQEGNPGPGKKPQAADAPIAPAVPPVDPNDRGHHAHAGNDHAIVPAPRFGPHDTTVSTTGIDVSEFDKTIDWQQVQSSGVKFAFVRATDGTTIQDSTFSQNWQGAEKAGVLVGPYHYFSTASPVDTQITNFLSTINKVDAGNLPPVLDVEDPTQFAKYTVPQRVAMIQQWLDGVQQKTGVKPMLYMSSSFSSEVLNNAPQFDSYKLWVADYTTDPQPIVPQPWRTWDFWQHTDSGKVPGIAGGVDMDIFKGPEASLPTITAVPPVVVPKI